MQVNIAVNVKTGNSRIWQARNPVTIISAKKGQGHELGEIIRHWGRSGDPELLTLKARRILEQTDTLFIPRSQPGRPSVAQSIVGQALDKQWHIIELLLPMTADESLLEQHWREAAG